MADNHEVRFKIDAFTCATIPMARLAEYMADLAAMLGEPTNVHFVRWEEGSAVLVQKIDEVAVAKVRERTQRVSVGEGPIEAMEAYRRINQRLQKDNSVGVLAEEGGAEIIRFPGREQKEPVTFGAFNQEGTLDGVIIRLGGTGDPVPVHLQAPNALHSHCFATRELAKALGRCIFGPELRVHGTGRWFRDESGGWVLNRFSIASFEVLNDQPLSAVVARLRDVPGSEWPEVADPWAELDEMRHGTDEAH